MSSFGKSFLFLLALALISDWVCSSYEALITAELQSAPPSPTLTAALSLLGCALGLHQITPSQPKLVLNAPGIKPYSVLTHTTTSFLLLFMNTLEHPLSSTFRARLQSIIVLSQPGKMAESPIHFFAHHSAYVSFVTYSCIFMFFCNRHLGLKNHSKPFSSVRRRHEITENTQQWTKGILAFPGTGEWMCISMEDKKVERRELYHEGGHAEHRHLQV